MKFLVDAHLPPSLCAVLARHGHDAKHTLDLPAKNATKDTILNQMFGRRAAYHYFERFGLFLFPSGLRPSVEACLGQDGKYVHGRVVFSFRASFVCNRSCVGTTHAGRNRSGCSYAARMSRLFDASRISFVKLVRNSP